MCAFCIGVLAAVSLSLLKLLDGYSITTNGCFGSSKATKMMIAIECVVPYTPPESHGDLS